MDLHGRDPAPWHRLKLQLRWLVFQDQFGNFVIVDPERPRPMGMAEKMKRPPTLYVAATDAELTIALEEVLHHFEHATRVTSRHMKLVERVEEARDRHRGIPGKQHRKAA